jgi:hypothetical protein
MYGVGTEVSSFYENSIFGPTLKKLHIERTFVNSSEIRKGIRNLFMQLSGSQLVEIFHIFFSICGIQWSADTA